MHQIVVIVMDILIWQGIVNNVYYRILYGQVNNVYVREGIGRIMLGNVLLRLLRVHRGSMLIRLIMYVLHVGRDVSNVIGVGVLGVIMGMGWWWQAANHAAKSAATATK